MQWYYALSGRQFGPVSADEMQNLTRSGAIRPDTLVWRAGMANWVPASQATELALTFDSPPSGPTPGVSPTVSPYAPPPSSFRPGGVSSYQGEQVSNTGPLVFSIIMTIVSFLMCCIPIGAIGIIFAAMIPSKVAHGDIKGAKQFSKISYICSFATLALILLYFTLNALFFVFAMNAAN